MKATLVSLVASTLLAGCASTEPQYRVLSEGAATFGRSEAEAIHAAAQPEFDGKVRPPNLSPPKILKSRFPDYPQVLRNAGITGAVLVRFYVESDGTVSNPVVVGQAAAELVAITLPAIREWKFAPAMKDGVAVRSIVQQTFEFRMN